MKKKSRLKSFFAILLAISMVFQQSSLTVLATDDTYVEDETVTPTPSESEAEEYTEEEAEPVAEEPEEPVAEEPEEPQEEPETPAEEPAQEPTEAPAEQPTEAPAEQPTEAPAAEPTEAPATEITEAPAAPEVTDTPAAEATATPVPEVSAVPSETPTPTPTEAPKTSFRYEDSRVVITAIAPEDANLPQNAEIKADYIAPGTDRYNAAVAAFNSQLSSQLGLNAKNTTAEYVLYDVYFLTADGKRIEPESGNVKVDMSFKQIQESTVDGDVVNKDVVHLDNEGQAEVVTEYINTNADGEITSMGFTQDSFSIVGGVTTYGAPSTGEENNSGKEAKLTDLVKAGGLTVSATSSVENVNRKGTLEFAFSYVIDDDKLDTAKNNPTWVYDISSLLSSAEGGVFSSIVEDSVGIIYDGNTNAGTYKVKNGKVYLYIDSSYIQNHTSDVKGTFLLNCSFDSSVIKTDSEKEIEFPGITDKTVVKFEEVKTETSKKVQGQQADDGRVVWSADGKLNYEITFKANADLDKLVLTDTLGAGQEIVGGKIKINDNIEVPVTVKNGVFTVDVKAALGKEIKAGDYYKVTYQTTVENTGWNSEITNKASWNWEGTKNTPEDETKITVKRDVTQKTVTKSETTKEDGTKDTVFTYTITVGDGVTDLNGYRLIDKMSKNQKYVEGSFSVTPELPGLTPIPPTDFSSDDNQQHTFLDYTFSKSTTSKYTITYKTTTEGTDLSGWHNVKNDIETLPPGENDGNKDSTYESVDYGSKSKAEIEKKFEKFDPTNDGSYVWWTITVKVPTGTTLNNVRVQENDMGYSDKDGGPKSTDGYAIDASKVTVVKEKDGSSVEDYTYDASSRSFIFGSLSDNIIIKIPFIYEAGFATITGAGKWFYNKGTLYVDNWIYIGEDSAKARYLSTYDVTKSHGNYNKKTREVTWSVVINDLAKTYTPDKNVTFKDTIPDGMSYKEGSFNVKVNDGAETAIVPTVENNTISARLGGLSGNKYIVTYTTVVDSKFLNDSHTYTNCVKVYDEGEKELTGTEDSITINHTYIAKSSDGIKEHDKLDYTITVNEEGLKLSDEATLTLIDELPEGVELMPNGIEGKTIFAADGENQPVNISYELVGRKLKITIPDEKHVVIKYRVRVSELGNQELINRVTLSGKVTKSTEDKKNVTVKSHGATISGSNDEFMFEKSNSDLSEKLSGATFKVYSVTYDKDTKKITGDPTLHCEVITDQNGQAKVTDIKAGVIYYWVETNPPAGYEISDPSKHYFVRYDDETNSKNVVTALVNEIIVANEDISEIMITKGGITKTVTDRKVNLTISKIVTGGDASEYAESFKIKVTNTERINLENAIVSNVVENSVSISGSTIEFSIAGNSTVSIKDLPAGTYTVEEMNGANVVYQTSYKLDGKDVANAEFKLASASDGHSVKITNTYPDKGSLELEKVFAGEKTDGDLSDEQKAAITFTVTGPDGYSKTIKYSEFTGGKYLLENLKTGEYKVVESGADFDSNYSLNVSYSVADGKTTVVKGETAGVKITNTYSREVGDLVVSKSVSGLTLSKEQKAAIIFTVTGPNGYENSKRYSEFVNESWELKNLEAGEYTVTETNADVEGYTRTTTYSVENGKAQVVRDKSTEVKVTNTYTRDEGSLELEKVFAGGKTDGDLSDEQKAAITFTVTGPDGYSKTIKYSEFTGGKYLLENLKTGEYKVVESGADFDSNYSLNVSYSVADGKTTVVKGETAGVKITNTYSREVGDLVVSKSVSGLTLSKEQKAAIIFTVTGPNGYENSKRYSEFVNESWELKNLEAGEYTVTETNADVEGYTRTTTYSVENGKAQVVRDKSTEVKVTNTYTRDEGSLELEKVFAGEKTDGDLSDEQKAAITFTVTGPDGYSKTIKYSEFTGGKYLLENLKTGEYKVVESGADFDSNYSLNVSYSVADGKTTVVKGETAGVKITNTYSREVGDLVVSKSVSGLTLSKEQKAAIIFTVTGPNGYENSKRYSEFVNESWELKNLEAGEYTVTETNADVEGYTRTTTYSVENGKAQVVRDKSTEVKVTNTYTRDASITLGAVKSYNKALTGGEFEFNLEQVKDANGTAITDSKPYTDSAKNNADGNVTFKKIKYTTAGTYYYKISEKNGGSTIKGIEYDKNAYVVTVTVAKVGNELVASVDKAIKDITFANTYKASADFQLKAQKSMKAESEKLGTFEFELKDADGTVIETVKNDEKGAVNFSKLSYTEKDAGQTFTYTVNEKIPSEADAYLYDKTVYTVTVNVEDNRDGTLKLTTKVNGEDYTEEAIKFVNDSTKVTITKVNDTDRKALLGAKLQIVDAKDKVVEKWTTDGKPHVIIGKLILGETYKLVEKEAPKGYKIADPITFVMQPDGTITVNAKPVSENKLTMVDAKLHFNVNKVELGNGKEVEGAHLVVIDKETGKNVDEWVSETGKTHDFGPKLEAGKSYILRETVAPAGYKYATDIGFTVKNDGTIETDAKTTTDKDGNKVYLVEDDTTKATITKVDDLGNQLSGVVLEIQDKDGNSIETWTTDGTPHVIIGKLILGETYKLVEKEAPKGYKIADPITFVMKPDGTITVNAKPVSENKLIMVDAKLHFNVNKVELGNGKEVEGAHLVVIDKETGKTVDEWVSETGKTHDFGPKLEAGKSYILRETVAPAGYKYATDIEFTVKKDGTIETNAKTTTDTDGNEVYLVEDDTTKATITKVDDLGNQLSGVVLEIQDKDGNSIETWTTDGTPHVITGKLILGETYKLVEKSAPVGYTLADPVKFTVSENDTDNKVEMKNTYSASGSLNLTAKKTLTTTETPLAKDQFTFELCDKDGKVLQTKTNDADGNVTFDEIKYSLVKDAAYKDNTDKKVDDTGEYQYTVNEVKGDAAGYTYDDTIYTIKVTVKDAGNGTLTVTPVIHSSKAASEDATVAGMEFTNIYTTSGQIVLGATKTLEGQTLEAEQFSFQATEIDADGNAVENGYNETVKNADGGTITFPIITYEKSGIHYYQITEVKDEKPAYKYDESKYVVKVDVTDDNAGKLTAKVTAVTKNGEPVENGKPVENGEPEEESSFAKAVAFTNTYSASADLELKAQKSMKVEGEELGTFEFELKDADGNVIETVKNDENGAINFSKLSYDEKAVGQTFTYTVNEKIPSEADIYVYDNTVYTVTVEVEDNRDGTLKLTTKVNGEDYTEEAIKFVNDTTKVTISKVDDTSLKALSGAKLQVVDADDKVVEEWVSDGTPHVITAKLVLGATYKLVEAEAPLGYEIAEPITFTVDADDTKNAVEMKDAMTKSETAAIEITKELKLNDALAGAKDMTFYVALFADEECTILASDVKALEFKNASSSTVTFTGVDLGRTYYVSETDEAGKAVESGMTPDGKVYIPVYPQGKEITVTEDGAKSSITFENQFNEWPDGFYKIANLNVTKELLGADGNALESDGVFYAGIFDDKECTTLSTRTEKNILTLDLAGGSTVSESTQAVVMPGESFNLYVAETDAEGNLVAGTEGFKYVVTVKDGNVYFDENNLNAKVTIINQEQPEATPTVTPEETPTPTPSSSTGVKTGDDTPIGFYMAMLFLAALAIEETTRRRRKKEQD